MQIGFVGLGKMGKNIVLHLVEQGADVIAWNRSSEPRDEVAQAGAKAVTTLEDLVSALPSPRIVWIMLPAGEVVDEYISQLIPMLTPGDLIVDGGNSFYKDSIRRAQKLEEHSIHFMDIGVSGGPGGARNGATLMIGGSQNDFERVKPFVEMIAAPNAYGFFGKVGSGHFAKMIHNGIEYGMMEAIAEGAAVLQKSDFDYDLADVFRVYNNRSVIESRLVEWSEEALKEDPTLNTYSSQIGKTGEGEWTVKTAQDMGVDVPVIADSLKVREDSKPEEDNFRNKLVSAMRGKFGGHAVKR